MRVNIYLSAVPGWDRIFVSTTPPTHTPAAGQKTFLAEVELPGFDKIDGVVQVVATPVDQSGIRLPADQKAVVSTE